MPDKSKDIKFWKDQLTQQRNNLRKLRKQQATVAKGDERLALLNQIEASENAIREAKAKLRQLGAKPKPAAIDPPEDFQSFTDHIIKSYPLPIAQACFDFNQAPESGRQFAALDRITTHLIKYLAAIFIGQAWRDKPPNYPLPNKLAWIDRPTMEDWSGALFELTDLYGNSPWKEKCKVADLLHACTRSLLGRQELVYAIDYLSDRLEKPPIDEPSVVNFLQLLAWYREREWQDDAIQYDHEKIEPLMFCLQPAMAVLINELEALRNYPLVYVERADEQDADVQLRLVKFMGRFTEDIPPANKPPLTLSKKEAQSIKRNRFYISATKGEPQLGLHPFFILYRWELFTLECHKATDSIEFRSCSTGKRLVPPAEARTIYPSWMKDNSGEPPAQEDAPIPGEEEADSVPMQEIPSDNSVEIPPLTWLSPEGREALEIALGETLRIGQFWLGIEFLLMGLSKQDGRTFSELFRELELSRGNYRGILRGLVEVLNKDWREKDALELGKAALPQLQPADPNTLAYHFHEHKKPYPVMTPRMLKILEDAHQLAGEAQVGHAHLLFAAIKHFQSPPVNLFFAIAAEAGWEPQAVIDWIKQQAGSEDQVIAENDQPAGKEPPAGTPWPPQSPIPKGKGMLGKYGRDLNAEARAGKIHPAIGVDDLLRRMKRILIQRETNNPLLIGEAGVGKTAIVEGLAYELVYSDPGMPELADKRIVEISINSLVGGTKYRGELEERVERLLAEVKTLPDVIVFIDEIHTVLGGGSDSLSNIANALKPALARGEFCCIGATTVEEYRRYIEKDAALRRRFETILVEEPSVENCIEILKGLFHQQGIPISEKAIEAAVRLSARYLQEERLPAKAIKLLHEAEAYIKLPSYFGLGEKAKEEETQPLFTEVNEDLIRYILNKKTGIPLERLKGDELERIKGMEEALKAQVIGQDEAVHAVTQVIKRSRAELRDPRRPVGVFLFVGPTGVGKTELARALAGFLFHDRNAMIRLDMSEYLEKHQVSRLIGAPPGYVGYEEEGQLTGRLRLHPYSVVLLDEIEKAHEEVHNIFLQLFDEGRLTDAKGRTVNGREAIFIMTSNVGSDIYAQDQAGYTVKDKLSPEWIQEKRKSVEKAIHTKFKPEFLNRVDRIIHFNPLTLNDVAKIFQLLFTEVVERLKERQKIQLNISPEAVAHVCQEGYNALNGARPLARAIDRLITEPLTDLILEGKFKAKDKIKINFNGSQLTFDEVNAKGKGGMHEP